METIGAFSTVYPLDILIADNHPDARTATTEILHHLGYSPQTAVTSMDVLRMTSDRNYDVILMNIQMPGLEKILTTPNARPGNRPIIIAISATAKPDFKETCLQALMDHRITRPMDQQELVLQLKACAILTGKCRIRE